MGTASSNSVEIALCIQNQVAGGPRPFSSAEFMQQGVGVAAVGGGQFEHNTGVAGPNSKPVP